MVRFNRTLTPTRHRYPAIPTDLTNPNDVEEVARVVNALRQRVEIFSRDRGRLEDSMVSVQDLLDLGIITPEQAETLRRS